MKKIYQSILAKVAREIIKQKSKDEKFVILDVRTKAEFQSGAIEGAINLDFYASNFQANLAKLDRNRTYLIYCRSGNRSKHALKMMQEFEFQEVYELDGGIISL